MDVYIQLHTIARYVDGPFGFQHLQQQMQDPNGLCSLDKQFVYLFLIVLDFVTAIGF